MRNTFLCLLFIGACYTSIAQQNRIDELSKRIASATTPVDKAKLLLLRSRLVSMQNLENAFADAQQALAIYQQDENKEGEVEAYLNLSGIYNRQNKLDFALHIDSVSYNLSRQINYKSGTAHSCSNLARSMQQKGNLAEAKKMLIKCVNLFEEAGLQTELPDIYNRLGGVYTRLSEFKMAFETLDKGIAMARSAKMDRPLASLYMAQGNAFSQTTQYDKATIHQLEALKIYERLNDQRSIGILFMNMSGTYSAAGHTHLALENLLKAVQIIKQQNNPIIMAGVYGNLGNLYSRIAKFDSAFYYQNRALDISLQAKDKKGEAFAYSNLGSIMLDEGKPGEALGYFKKAQALDFNIKSNRHKASLLNKMGVALTLSNRHAEAEKYLLQALSFIKNDSSKIAPSIFRSLSEHYRQIGRFEEALAYQSKYLAYRDTILHEGEVTNILKSQQQYEIEKRDAQTKAEKDQKDFSRLQVANRNKTIWLLASLIALLVVLGAFLFYRYRLRQVLKVDKMRKKISGDLHDDIGSTLSSINIYSELAKTDKDNHEYLNFIQQHTQSILSSLDELVWSINPKNDNIDVLIERMRSFALPLLEARKIKTEFIFESEGNSGQISLEQRTNLYFAFKEMINNVVKHADSNQCIVKVIQKKHNFCIEVSDNGKGFLLGHINGQRNGLKNLKERAEAGHGSFKIDTQTGAGTRLTFQTNFK